MVGVSKTFPPQKQVLKNIYLSFFYGAKIGIIGLNGSGKSTLLKIIAGIEKDYQGEVVFSPGYSVGYLEQDPKLESGKTVKEIVQEGVQDIVDALKEFEEVNQKFGDPEVLENPDKLNALINRQAELQDKIDATDAWNLDSRLERAMDALRCPPEDQVVDTLSGGERRRVALCRLLLQQPDVLLLDEPLAALDLKMRKDMQMELKEMHKSLGITFVYVTHDQEEALTLSDTIVVMSEGKIQQIGTPIDIYNEPINAFVADFIGESNILNGTMIHDKLVRFCGTEFECVDEGFGENVPVDVVIRPEDLYIFPVSEMAQLVGVVETSIFKGVHYEMTVLCGGYEFLVQDYHHFEVGAEVGLLVKPFDIHIMKKERVCNTFEGKLLDATHVEFLGCNFECVPVEGIAFDTNVKVEVDFEKVILQDNEEDGTLTGEVKFILYKGDHYHLTVLSDWDENVFVDTNDVWDDGDRVGITIPPDAIRIVKITD